MLTFRKAFTTFPVRPAITLLAAALLLLLVLGSVGCKASQSHGTSSQPPQATLTSSGGDAASKAEKFEMDRKAILGMAGQYEVSFDFREVLAVRDGYELAEPYSSQATELVKVIEDTGEFISLQHILVVWMEEDEPHVIKHWRQDWTYQGTDLYQYQGDNLWTPYQVAEGLAKGAWVQAVFQVDDSPRYWGIGAWEHRGEVSTWSAQTQRPLPRRELSVREDYQLLDAVNTHVVTADGWVHEQRNRKIDIHNTAEPMIAIELGVNTYTKTDEVDFTAAEEFWDNSQAFWAEVRGVWGDIYAKRSPIQLQTRVRGDTMFTHMFDLADLYWDVDQANDAKPKIREIISEFLSRPVAQQ